jgi:hypothetical protein
MIIDDLLTLPVRYFAGDTLPTIKGVYIDTPITGVVIDLLLERPPPAGLLVLTATHSEDIQGSFFFKFRPGDLVEGCNQEGTIRITYPSTEVEHAYPRLRIDVEAI